MYDDNFIAHINANWLSPVKVRQILIGGDKKMAVFNDLEQAEKLKIYDSGLVLDNKEDIRETMIGYRTGDMLAPKIPTTEALKDESNISFTASTRAKSRSPAGPWALKWSVCFASRPNPSNSGALPWRSNDRTVSQPDRAACAVERGDAQGA